MGSSGLPKYSSILNLFYFLLWPVAKLVRPNLPNSSCRWLPVWLHHQIDSQKKPWLLYVKVKHSFNVKSLAWLQMQFFSLRFNYAKSALAKYFFWGEKSLQGNTVFWKWNILLQIPLVLKKSYKTVFLARVFINSTQKSDIYVYWLQF
jgi:hypothetical protein